MIEIWIDHRARLDAACRLRPGSSLCKRVTANCSKSFEVTSHGCAVTLGHTRPGMLGDPGHFFQQM